MSRGVHDGLVAKSPGVPDTEHPAAALFHLASRAENPSSSSSFLAVMLDVSGHLKDERTLRHLRDLVHKFEQAGGTSHLILIDHSPDLPSPVRAIATVLELELPDEEALEQIVRDTLRQRNAVSRIQVELNRKGLQTIIRNLRGLSARQAKQVVLDTVAEDQRFDLTDVNTVLAQKRKHLQSVGLLDYIESPVDLSEIGGLRKLKAWLKQREDALSDEAAAFGISPPRGVLMLGVQGAGKSLSAKAVATAWQRPLLRMDVGALYDKYIGESERRLRDALHQAEMMSPIILWIDEIEKAFASAAAQSTDGGLSKRMFGTLLTWMQEHKAPVFLIATANDIEALPPELLRKGRFDEIFFVDLPDADARRAIFEIHLRKRKRDPQKFDVAALAAAAEGFSGAEIEQAVIAGLHEAFAAKAQLATEHVLSAIRNSPPLSVTMAEKVQSLRDWAEGRCMCAD
jgi:SpoVK/Ycf46/Vps4 family AAA+-type ATPase